MIIGNLKTEVLPETIDLLIDVSQVTELRSFNQSHLIQSTHSTNNVHWFLCASAVIICELMFLVTLEICIQQYNKKTKTNIPV